MTTSGQVVFRYCGAANWQLMGPPGNATLVPQQSRDKHMKSALLLSALVIGALGAPIAVFADNDVSAPTVFVKDSAITVAVKAKLAAEHVGSLTSIHVDTDNNGVVWLKGSVETQAQADQAIAIAKGTDDVKSVHSDLMVKKP
jgi:hyperosmotically inducible protein